MSRARTLAIAGAGLGGIYFIGTQMNDFKTPGIRNIERRHTAAGGAGTHTPAIGSKLGDEHQTEGRQETQKGELPSFILSPARFRVGCGY